MGSNFWGKGTAETRLFGEGKCCIFRWVDLDRGWCNIHDGVGVGLLNSCGIFVGGQGSERCALRIGILLVALVLVII